MADFVQIGYQLRVHGTTIDSDSETLYRALKTMARAAKEGDILELDLIDAKYPRSTYIAALVRWCVDHHMYVLHIKCTHLWVSALEFVSSCFDNTRLEVVGAQNGTE